MSLHLLAFIVILQYVGLGSTSVQPRVDPLVDSKVGLIRGLRGSDGDYSMFLGIPYAKVDKDNVFGDSTPYPKFEETFEAFDDTAICPQREEFTNTVIGTLDCLHLNVFVPTQATSSNRLPVLVWIHGGGFDHGFFGRYVYGPKFLIRHGVLLVTVNYRLGPYGFMCTDTPQVPGNQGLKDQATALRWVKENIEAFGGDSNQITLMGESAGSASVDFHLHNAQENVFHQAIMQSGTALGPWVMLNPGNEGPLKLAGHLGLVTDDVKEALTFLATVDTNLVMAATIELGLNFRPCVEKEFDDANNFLTNYPVNLSAPKVKKIPLLIGFNNDEGLLRSALMDLETTNILADTINASFDMDSQSLNEMSEILRHFYFGGEEINDETRRQVIDLSSDFFYVHPTLRSVQRYLNIGFKTIFSYVFSYYGERNFVKYKNGITMGGACHADEISFLFDVSYMKSIMPEDDQIVVDRITTLWTNFVKYGDPTPETTELLPVKWSPTTDDHWYYLNMDRELTLETRPFHERVAFLDLFFRMNEKHVIGYQSEE